MSDVSIHREKGGQFRLQGALTFQNVGDAVDLGRTLFRDGRAVVVDLQEVTRADSAGLALLIEWMRQARHGGGYVAFRNVPEQILHIAEASGLDKLLPTVDG